MKVELRTPAEPFQPVVIANVRQMILTDDLGTPLALAVEIAPGEIEIKTVRDDRDFNLALHNYGIVRAVTVERVRPQPQGKLIYPG